MWGILDAGDNPVYSKASYVTSVREWDLWSDPNVLQRPPAVLPRERIVSGAQGRFARIRDKARTVGAGEEITRGMRVIETPGHTQGHISLELAGGLVISGDALRANALLAQDAATNLSSSTSAASMGAGPSTRRGDSDLVANIPSYSLETHATTLDQVYDSAVERKAHNDRSKYRENHIGDGIRNSHAKNRGLTLRDITGPGHGGVHCHRAGKGPTDDHGVHAQNTMREQCPDNQRRQRHNYPGTQKHESIGLDRGQRCRTIRQPDRGNKSAQPNIDQGLLSGRREGPDGRPARAQPPADQSGDEGSSPSTKRQRNRADRETEQSDQQSDCESDSQKGNVRAIVGAQRLADFRHDTLQTALKADKRHDVADVN